MSDENSTENATVSTESPSSTDPLLDIIVLEGHNSITINRAINIQIHIHHYIGICGNMVDRVISTMR
jgi:hypothetical protein